MSFFISDALAQGAEGGTAGTLELILPLVLMFGIFYFLLIRPQQKKAKEHKNMVGALSKGDEIITNGGLLAKISDVDDNFLTCTISDKVEVKIQRHAVSSVLPKGTIKNL
ncbi:MAG: preprotein translocase subunit YajC [Gammaproteobacteria bacterium]|nr:preprotein translocase subunit YajC [Gammaproteobacteria bacterium]MCP4980173.1 preprotein translocase subunit YajC [Gammaproteobacteria bacterium]